MMVCELLNRFSTPTQLAGMSRRACAKYRRHAPRQFMVITRSSVGAVQGGGGRQLTAAASCTCRDCSFLRCFRLHLSLSLSLSLAPLPLGREGPTLQSLLAAAHGGVL
eukprot:GHVU01084719.1.p1 GENE.GHVU01084719.1~~GHVU01084719.1.p1  ORF type:complete len:108 (+),score=10.53 GHVU01084719.1:906-1229(+)